MSKILIISSQIHKELSAKQLENCIELLNKSPHEYELEILDAGAYEIPYVINTFTHNEPFDAYIALGLVLKANNDHYDYIMSHIKTCFTHFALNNIIVGNGIISGSTLDDLAAKIDSKDPCFGGYASACKAVDALLHINDRMKKHGNYKNDRMSHDII